MSDLINRQDAIDAVCMEWCNVKHQDCKHPFDIEKDDYYWCDGCETVLQTLSGLPSAEHHKLNIAEYIHDQYPDVWKHAEKELEVPSAEPDWIPVTERLPKEECKHYWICTDTGYQCECRWTNVNHFWTNLTTDWHWNIFDVPQYSHVVAWMPLPEPWEGETK